MTHSRPQSLLLSLVSMLAQPLRGVPPAKQDRIATPLFHRSVSIPEFHKTTVPLPVVQNLCTLSTSALLLTPAEREHPLLSSLSLLTSISSIFTNIILPLARCWSDEQVITSIREYLVVFKPNVCPRALLSSLFIFILCLKVFPAIFDWVSYPITLLIKSIYEQDIDSDVYEKDPLQYQLRLELIACLERVLCFCHTGNASVLATATMHPLGLSRGILKDGFPVLLKLFEQPSVSRAMKHGFGIDPTAWPKKDGYPAVASKKAQIYSYSLAHFLVSPNPSISIPSHPINGVSCVCAWSPRAIRGNV